MKIDSLSVVATHDRVAELDRLGDEIAELSAHLDAATARLLDLIREFDARAGWNTGFRSCAEWLSWRGRARPGAGPGGGCGARAPPPPPPGGAGPGARGRSQREGRGPPRGGAPRNRGEGAAG